MAYQLASRLLLLVSILAISTACNERKDLSGKQRDLQASSDKDANPHANSKVDPLETVAKPAEEHIAIDLLAMRSNWMRYWDGALHIDAAGPDFIKYSAGGRALGWLRSIPLKGGETATLVDGLGAEIHFPFDKAKGGVALGKQLRIRFRAKSAVQNQLVSIFLNERKLGDLAMTGLHWQDYSVGANSSLVQTGMNKLRFYFRSAGTTSEHRSAAAFSSFQIGNEDSPLEVIGLKGSASVTSAGLSMSGKGRVSMYVYLPPNASSLRFTHRGQEAKIFVQGDKDSEARRIWKSKTEREGIEQEVALRSFRGEVIRLDLISEGAASWGQLRITQRAVPKTSEDTPLKVDHIILWSVASLRHDMLNDPAGKEFRDFLSKAFVADPMYSSVPTAGAAAASSMTGSFHSRGRVLEDEDTLAQSLQRAGYSTALISGNGFISDANGFAKGFDLYDNPMRRQHHHGARTLWRQAKRFLSLRKDSKSYVHIATVEPHIPYRPSEGALKLEWPYPAPFPAAKTLHLSEQVANGRRLSEREKAYVSALYDASVRDVAKAFSEMLADVEGLGLQGRVAIILSGDHGEEKWERGNIGHGTSLADESTRVPFGIWLGGKGRAKRLGSGTSTDIRATIHALADLEAPSGAGLSLWGAKGERSAFLGLQDGTRGVLWNRRKLVHQASGQVQLFDLSSDPEEEEDLSVKLPVTRVALELLLATYRAFEGKWNSARWGRPEALTEAFARDQGL